MSSDAQTQKAENKLINLLQSLNIHSKGKTFDSYQFGTYGIGGFIDDHFDTYGTPDSPMEDVLDLVSGTYIVVKNSFSGNCMII